MSQIYILFVVGMLLVLPLAPAAAIFWLLSTRHDRLKDRVPGGVTRGVITIPVINFRMSFEAFGSTASYLVLLVFAALMYFHVENEERERLAAHYAWRVSVPVIVENPDGTTRGPWDPIYTQVTATLMPFQNFDNNYISFWVAKNDDRFPQVNLSIAGSPRTSINLNDPAVAKTDVHTGRIAVEKKIIKLMPTELQR